ncbi:ricin B-like lectin R40G3 [Tripterygium wilfordii]|uniref:ricin B-like lectin R40G3 n=1 Tax=Tripterygium wilfordii TaxID=458696 RepID=UPI0018F81018|nr:ricin B-like lectin R40G3 [Tripterygium wilfordii]
MSATVLTISTEPSYRVYCKDCPDYNIAVGVGMAILAPTNKNDYRQYWYKKDSDEMDTWGFPAFSLVNRATGQTLQHSFDHPIPVRLVYNPSDLDRSVLWAQAEDRGEGFKAIRSLDCKSHLEACALYIYSYHGAIIIGGVWDEGKNQLWKIEPHS